MIRPIHLKVPAGFPHGGNDEVLPANIFVYNPNLIFVRAPVHTSFCLARRSKIALHDEIHQFDYYRFPFIIDRVIEGINERRSSAPGQFL